MAILHLSSSSRSGEQPSLSTDEELQLTVGQTEYILIPCRENFLSLENSSTTPTLILVYRTEQGQAVSGSALRHFRTDTLDQDDVFQPEFFSNIVFSGARRTSFSWSPMPVKNLPREIPILGHALREIQQQMSHRDLTFL
ncbi:hypothetical protein AJ79_05692 [Helicocarpus griseus UAMH5409]|uniref:Uncharacterized protein n=1 Tax=Helicocarpus griseus UAMH5409 TaxID=1447875 RepID=A0A2B7XKD3_9EURO|nr:hypothetical protein AJ79_05692 [Helicocarpus griseus UAMH5409]